MGSALTGLSWILCGIAWMIKKSFRRLLPIYWAALAWLLALVRVWLHLPAPALTVGVGLLALVAAGWKANSSWVRGWRTGLVTFYGLWAAFATPIGHGWSIPLLAAVTLLPAGWPWWYRLRTRHVEPEPAPPVRLDVSDEWIERWKTEVIDQGVCTKTRMSSAAVVRPGVVEASIRILPGGKITEVAKTGPLVETALDMPEGSIGWRRTGRAAWLRLVLVEQSYIAGPVTYRGPSYQDGRLQVVAFADGTPGWWIHLQRRSGTLNGLVVGSSNAGKSRALGVIIDSILNAGLPVVVGDPQGGQSLPAWRGVVGEYHDDPDAVRRLICRLHAEVMERSRLLSRAGVSAYDPDDPRIQKLGIAPLTVIIDECQLVLVREDRVTVQLAEEIAATDRKTGVSFILATQIPQMKSLGGSIRLRDALVAGNALILRLSNRGSSTTILPDDFVGDPFAIPVETLDKETTAGCGYLRSTDLMGMMARVPYLDEDAAAARAPRIPVQWLVPQPADETPAKGRPAAPVGVSAVRPAGGNSTADGLAAAFGVRQGAPVQTLQRPSVKLPGSTKGWVLACLRSGPASAQALLDRSDCPVKQPQLYSVLSELAHAGLAIPPAVRGDAWRIARQ